MPRLHYKISPIFRQALIEVIEPIEKRFQLQVAVDLEGAPDDDEDLLDAWRDSLLEQLREDAHFLLELLQRTDAEENLTLSEKETESALRAAAAVRLKIREAFLHRIPDEVLECDGVDISSLGLEEQKPFLCYDFLYRFQERLVAQLMPEMYGLEPGWEDEEDSEE